MRTTYFPSGSNHQGEIQGFNAIGANVGVALHELNEAAIVALEACAGSDTLVFVDSGAFSEVDFPGGVPTIVDAIDHDEWCSRLAIYKRLARVLGSQLYAVAPDCVAHQAITLERLETYVEDVRELRMLGANIIVGMQRGALDAVAFDVRVTEILGFDDFIRGIPSKKNPTPTSQIVDFLAARPQAQRVHLLGLGPRGDRWAEVTEALAVARPDLDLFADSVFLRACTGKTNGPGGGPRALTKAHDDLVENEIEPRAYCDDENDWTDSFESVNAWAGPAARKHFIAALTGGYCGLKLTDADVKAIKRDPLAWLNERDEDGMTRISGDPRVGEAFNAMWQGFYFEETVVERKRESIVRAFGPMMEAGGLQ